MERPEKAEKECWAKNLEPSHKGKLALQASKRSIRHPGRRGRHAPRHSDARECGISRELQEAPLFMPERPGRPQAKAPRLQGLEPSWRAQAAT